MSNYASVNLLKIYQINLKFMEHKLSIYPNRACRYYRQAPIYKNGISAFHFSFSPLLSPDRWAVFLPLIYSM